MKPKTSPTSPKAKVKKDSDIDKLYEESMKTIDRPQNGKVRLSISLLIIIILIGFVAGVVGQFALLSYGPDIPVLQQLQIFNTDDTSLILTNRNKDRILTAEQIESISRDLANSIVGVYEEKEGVTGIDAAYLAGERVADGLVITDDGYVVVANNLIDETLTYVVLTNDQTEYTVKRVISDERAGFTYLKIDASNLETVSFSNADAIYSSEEIVILNGFTQNALPAVLKTPVLANNYVAETVVSDLVRSSEDFLDTILLGESIPANFNQRIAFTLDKKALGVVQLVDNQYSIVPFSRLEPAVNAVLAGDTVTRAFLGITYVDLATTSATLVEGYSAGALIYSIDEDISASIIENSPAEKAGLQADDLITEIDGVLLNENQNLADIIVEHEAGDTITLTLIRDDVEQKINITLDPIK